MQCYVTYTYRSLAKFYRKLITHLCFSPENVTDHLDIRRTQEAEWSRKSRGMYRDISVVYKFGPWASVQPIQRTYTTKLNSFVKLQEPGFYGMTVEVSSRDDLTCNLVKPKPSLRNAFSYLSVMKNKNGRQFHPVHISSGNFGLCWTQGWNCTGVSTVNHPGIM